MLSNENPVSLVCPPTGEGVFLSVDATSMEPPRINIVLYIPTSFLVYQKFESATDTVSTIKLFYLEL